MLSVMVLDVCVQECLGNKRLVTQFTLVWSLPGVVPHVYGQGWRLCKNLAALFAGIRLHTCVTALVNIQIRRWVECFATNVTHKWFLTSVNTPVCLKWSTTFESLPTDITEIVGFSSVILHMIPELTSKEKALSTSFARKASCTSFWVMNNLMAYQIILPWEFLPTCFTFVLLPSVIPTHVTLIFGFCVETFPTNFTLESVFL